MNDSTGRSRRTTRTSSAWARRTASDVLVGRGRLLAQRGGAPVVEEDAAQLPRDVPRGERAPRVGAAHAPARPVGARRERLLAAAPLDVEAARAHRAGDEAGLSVAPRTSPPCGGPTASRRRGSRGARGCGCRRRRTPRRPRSPSTRSTTSQAAAHHRAPVRLGVREGPAAVVRGRRGPRGLVGRAGSAGRWPPVAPWARWWSRIAWPMPREPLWSISQRRPSSSACSSTKWLPLPSVPSWRAASLALERLERRRAQRTRRRGRPAAAGRPCGRGGRTGSRGRGRPGPRPRPARRRGAPPRRRRPARRCRSRCRRRRRSG